MRRTRLLVEALEDRLVPSTYSLSSSFNFTAVAPGSTLWFSSVASSIAGVTYPTTIHVTNQTLTFTDSTGGSFNVSLPNADLILTPGATSATTTFDATNNKWVSSDPSGLAGNVFLSGVQVNLPSGLHGADNPVTWSGDFSSNAPGASFKWQFAAAAYSSFSTTYNSLGVKPCDNSTASSYANSDKAGTPENYKAKVIGGAMGTGGTNYTGNYSTATSVTPTVPNGFISGTVFNDANADGVQQASEAVLSGWTVQLYTSTNGVLSGSPLATTTSDALGGYSFSGLGAQASGTSYVVAAVLPANWVQTNPQGSSGTTTLPGGQRGWVYPISDGNDLISTGSGNTEISGTGTATFTSFNAGVGGSVSANDGIGDSFGLSGTYFDQLNMTFTPSSGSAIPFYSYCIDLFHDLSLGQSLSVYVAGNENTAFVNGARMAYIYQTYGAQNLSGNPAQAAAVQLALWDLTLNNHNPTTFVKDADGTYSSGDQSVYSVSFNSASDAAAVAPLVAQYLQASIGATTQAGWLDASANGTSSNRGQSLPFPSPTYNFGATSPVTLGGTVYEDQNDNGVFENGEPGIAGVTLTLTGTNGLGQAITATTTTGANGTYSFSSDSGGKSLLPGTYQIAETVPSGYLANVNSVGTVNGTANGTLLAGNKIGSITLTSGQGGVNYNFGDVKPVTLAGLVYQDTNANGVLNTGEPGIAGVTLTLSGTNGMGQAISATTTTAADGTYSFSSDSSGKQLLPGTYQIAETVPGGYVASANSVGTVNGSTDGTLLAGNKIGSIVMTSGQGGVNYNFGDVKPVTLAGLVYQDTNANGVLNAGEPGIAGVTLTLSGTNGMGQAISATATTAADGTYSFSSDSSGKQLLPGTYQIAETVPGGYVASANSVGTVNGSSDGTLLAGNKIGSIVMTSGQGGINYNFGDVKAVTISGLVYQDSNGNGKLDTGEPGIGSVTLTLSGTNGLGQAVTATTTTLGNGTYSFSSDSSGNALLPGTYQIAETLPSGYLAGTNAVGTVNGASDGTLLAGNKIGSIALTSGQSGINYNFGDLKPTTLAGIVYQDNNRNGVLDSGEPGIGGVTLTLTGTNGLGQAITATTTTAANGSYNFSTDGSGNVLLPGTYQIAETQPSGYFQGSNTVGTVNGSTDGVLVPTDKIGSIVLTSGQSGINYNFGEVKAVSIGGTVYLDANANGVLDAGESGIAGVTLTLTGTTVNGQAVSVTTTTAANGTYSFSTDGSGAPLWAGTYQVAETQPSGYLQGSNTVGTVNGTTDGTLVPTDKIGSIVIAAGQNGINYNFGEVQPVTIAGEVYKDSNGNGRLDTGEPGIANVTLTLTGTNNQGQSITATTTTAANGTYSFSKDSNGNVLAPGTYQIVETTPSGYVQLAANVGTVGGLIVGAQSGPGTIGSIALGSGQNGVDYDFGLTIPVAISGYVYMDYDGDGLFDNLDTGYAGQTLKLTGTNILGQSITMTTTSGSNGYYLFAGILPGTYMVSVVNSAYNTDAANVGTVNGTSVGQADSSFFLFISQILLHAGDSGINYDFGLQSPVA